MTVEYDVAIRDWLGRRHAPYRGAVHQRLGRNQKITFPKIELSVPTRQKQLMLRRDHQGAGISKRTFRDQDGTQGRIGRQFKQGQVPTLGPARWLNAVVSSLDQITNTKVLNLGHTITGDDQGVTDKTREVCIRGALPNVRAADRIRLTLLGQRRACDADILTIIADIAELGAAVIVVVQGDDNWLRVCVDREAAAFACGAVPFTAGPLMSEYGINAKLKIPINTPPLTTKGMSVDRMPSAINRRRVVGGTLPFK
jgi:hypothetical protein